MSTTARESSTAAPGVAFDTGGTGKGLAADLLARRLGDYGRFVVDCGGDIRVGGFAIEERPFEIEVENPLTGERAHVVTLTSGGIATSGLNVRLWQNADGRFAHHLLDPFHRRARLDRPDRRHGFGRHRPRGGDALQGRFALRPPTGSPALGSKRRLPGA